MIKQTVTFTDFNGDPATETLHFNLTKTELIDMLDMGPRLQAWLDRVTNEGIANLTVDQTREFFTIVKELINASYGKRSGDGRRFLKSEEILQDFQSSASYDALLMDMFSNPEKMNTFMVEILPKDIDSLVAEAEKKAQQNTVDAELPADTTTGGEMTAVDEEVPAWIRENREPTKKELQSMTPKQMQEAYLRRLSQ